MNTASVQITFLNFRQRYGEARIAESQQRMSKGDISDQHPLLARVKIRPSRNYPNFPDLLAWAYHTPIDDIHAYVISLRVFWPLGFRGFFHHSFIHFRHEWNTQVKKIGYIYIYISFFSPSEQQHKDRFVLELTRMRAVSALLRSRAELSLWLLHWCMAKNELNRTNCS